MLTEHFSIFIKAGPDHLFPLVGDLLRHQEWTSDPIEIESLTSGPIKAGNQYRSTAHFMGMLIEAELKVKEYESPKRFAFTVVDRTGQYEHIFTLEPENGGTRVVREIHAEDTPLARILHVILYPLLIKPEANKALQLLKQKAEQNDVQGKSAQASAQART